MTQAGLFFVALTAFVLVNKQDLKASPADEMVYDLRQHSTILSQISVQLSSLAPQISVPSTPPPPFPAFTPSASNISINIFWFMSLVFSLIAAVLAIFIQQWVRNYMRVFQQSSDPLKSSRLRQYLYEGWERWCMPMVAEIVPGLLYISVFLFFAGLGDSLLNISTPVGSTTLVFIGISTLVYIAITFVPIIYLQSPYQSPFSGILWYYVRSLKSLARRYRGSDGEMRIVRASIAQGQMHFAMEETDARQDRDDWAIRLLIDNLTEDVEMEKLLPAIPGSFNTDWGTEVWRRVGGNHGIEDQRQDESVAILHRDTTTHLHPHSTTALHELSTRVARSVEMCKNRKLFANNDGLWWKQTRACIETTASLVCCANANLALFGGVSKLLGEIGSFEKIRELSLAGTDQMFVMRWTCLSLVAI